MALVVLLPLFSVIALFRMRKTDSPRIRWAGVVVLQVILSFSAWAAVETGEDDEDYYEHGVAEEALESHEELAEGFQVFTMVALPLAAAGLLAGRIGVIARYLYLAISIGLLIVGTMVGHRGGKIIYPQGARATAERLTE